MRPMFTLIIGAVGWCLACLFLGLLVGERRIVSKTLDELRRGPLDKIDET